MRTFDLKNAEATGHNLQSYLQHMRVEDTRPLLKKHHFEENIQLDKWYPAENVVAFVWDVAKSPNALYNLVSIGMEAAKNVILPPELERMSFEDFVVHAIPFAYSSQVRGGDLGFIRGEKVADKHVKIICVTPLPDDGWYGSVYGIARRFLPKETAFRVEYDKEALRSDQGGDETIIHVMWE